MELFEKAKLGPLTLRNRIIRSATHDGLADEDGKPTAELIQRYKKLASGGLGAIIVGYAGVNQAGKSSHHHMLMLDRDEQIPAFRELTEAVRQEGAVVIQQLAHCGRNTKQEVTGYRPLAPSPGTSLMFSGEKIRVMTEQDIRSTIDDFTSAVGRARRAGFDAVQIHGAHSYLLAQFLSPLTNRRKDRWGGSLENRYRIVGEILSSCRNAFPGFPVLIKLNARDQKRGGLTLVESRTVAAWLERDGCAGIEVSCGSAEQGFAVTRGSSFPAEAITEMAPLFRKWPRWARRLIRPLLPIMLGPIPHPLTMYNADAARALRESCDISVINVGGLPDLESMRRVLHSGSADFVSLSRPLILEPDLIEKYRTGKQENARCIYCNYCTIAQLSGPTRCYYGRLKGISNNYVP